MNRCHCDIGFGGPDCALVVPVTTPVPTDAQPTPDNTIKMEKKETNYGKQSSDQFSGSHGTENHETQTNQTNNDDFANLCYSSLKRVSIARISWKSNFFQNLIQLVLMQSAQASKFITTTWTIGEKCKHFNWILWSRKKTFLLFFRSNSMNNRKFLTNSKFLTYKIKMTMVIKKV